MGGIKTWTIATVKVERTHDSIFVEVSSSMPVLGGWNPGLQSLPARTCMDSVNSAQHSALEMCYVRQFDLNV